MTHTCRFGHEPELVDGGGGDGGYAGCGGDGGGGGGGGGDGDGQLYPQPRTVETVSAMARSRRASLDDGGGAIARALIEKASHMCM